MAINLDFLARTYFWFDKPVPYKLANNNVININPIDVQTAELFLWCIDIISIDKNSLADPKYISMSYLDFIIQTFVMNEDKALAQEAVTKITNIFALCLGWKDEIKIGYNDRLKVVLHLGDMTITGSQFEDIRRIILYQNLLDFDDSYINPDVKKAIEDTERAKNKNLDPPNLERRMAIISAHTGISKSEQMTMTYRSHSALFREVYGEVDYTSARTAVLIGNMFSKQKSEFDDWIYRKKHNKYEKYFTSERDYNQSMGGATAIHSQ